MNTYSVTDLRHKTLEVINTAIAKGYVHIFQNSKPSISIVNSQYLEALQEAYEDYLDIQEIERTKNEPTISLDDYLKKNKIKL